VTASSGIVLFAGGLSGYFLARAWLWQRAFLIVGGLLLVKPGLETDIAGAVLTGIVVAAQLAERRRAAPAAAE
jgi:TRAP-type uncharacterized transport system fused permease subunit